MELIQNNPYRIAGILANSSEKELQKQKSKITKYASIGKVVDSEYDFSFLSIADRSESSLKKSFSCIEQNQDKVSHSLFWFLKANPFDETALNYLINGDKDKAIEIWEKVTTGKEVTSKNFSCFNNIGTLKLLEGSKDLIKEGIEAKIKLIESDNFTDFVHTVADQTYTIDNQKQAKIIIDELLSQFKGKFSISETIELFNNCNGLTQKYLSQKFTEEPIHNIEAQIESTKKRRKLNKNGAYDLGLKLYVNCKEDLAILKKILGASDLKFKMAADNLAKEVMQCGIDYFQEWKETKDPSKEGLKLLKYAQSIAVGTQTKDRVKENIEGVEEWAETAPIKEDLAFITQKLTRFQNLNDTVSNADDLVTTCKPKLHNIKSILGINDDFYMKLSSAVVNNAQGMLVTVINEAQQDPMVKMGIIDGLRDKINSAVRVSDKMGTMDMVKELKIQYDKNHSTLKSIASQIGTPSYSSSSSSRTTSSASSSDSSIPWLKIIGWGIFLIFILRACAG